MAKLPERYEPGELDRTRRNLGQLSAEERRRMQAKLGGEVGTERTADDIEDKYRKLKLTSPVVASPRRTAAPVKGGTASPPPRPHGLTRDWPRMGYFDRLKTDFFCARPEVRVKTLGQALTALISFSADAPDLVSRNFILDGDHVFAKGIENLVLAVRGLTSKNNKNALQAIRRQPLYNDILKVLRAWDIEAIGTELSRLQANPGGKAFSDLVPLLQYVLRPLFVLSRLSVQTHLLPALAKMHDHCKTYLVQPADRERALKYFVVAREELPLVFSRLKFRLYPLLLKLLSDRWLTSDAFFKTCDTKLLDFLNIAEKDLLVEPPHGMLAAPAPLPEETAAPAPAAETEGPRELAPVPKPAQKGLDILDQLFPRAGWKNLETRPDLYAYFEELFDFPKGLDLVSVRDPLQIIYPLSLVLENLFYGFQEVRFGQLRTQFGQVVDLQTELDKAVSQWHFFMEEVFAKNYLVPLQEYCRLVDRSGRLAPESKKAEHQLIWLKKRYLLPHLMVPVFKEVRPKNLGYPTLSEQVTHLLGLLASIVVEMEQGVKKQAAAGLPKNEAPLQTILNAFQPFKFPVANIVSRRLTQILRPEARTNRSLVWQTFSLLLTLDFLLNNAGSVLYEHHNLPLYRTSGNEGEEIPQYRVEKQNTLALLKKLPVQPTLDDLDPPEDLYGPYLVLEELKKQVQAHHTDQKPFCITAFRLAGMEGKSRQFFDQQLRSLRETAESVHFAGLTVGALQDGTVVAVHPAGETAMVQAWGRQVLAAAASRPAHPIGVTALVLPFQKNWTVEKLLALPARGFLLGQEYPPQVLGVFKPELQTFEFLADLPLIPEASDPPDPNSSTPED